MLQLQSLDHPCRHSLLAIIKMDEAKHLASVVHLRALVLKAASQHHVPVEAEPHILREGAGMGLLPSLTLFATCRFCQFLNHFSCLRLHD